MMAKKKEGKVVAAVGLAAVGSGGSLSRDIEAAMAKAVEDCFAEGITDPEEHKIAMMAARERVKKESAEAAEAASKDSAKD
jgi:formaldehyde-activating enzyme involved in methanogenesis